MPEHRAARPVVTLRPVEPADLPALFRYEQDPASNAMAAVFPRDEPAFRASFREVWSSALADSRSTARAILADGALVGRTSTFPVGDETHVGYWIARCHWGRGIGTRALRLPLTEVVARPSHGIVAAHNVASIRILERAGFRVVGERDATETDRVQACREILLILT